MPMFGSDWGDYPAPEPTEEEKLRRVISELKYQNLELKRRNSLLRQKFLLVKLINENLRMCHARNT